MKLLFLSQAIMTQLHDRMLKFLSSVFFFRYFLLLENGNKSSIFSWVLSQNFSQKKTVKQWKISKTAKLNEKLAFSEVYSMPRSQNFLKVLLLNPHQDFETLTSIFWAWVTKSFTAKNRSSYFSWNKPQQGRNKKKKKERRWWKKNLLIPYVLELLLSKWKDLELQLSGFSK